MPPDLPPPRRCLFCPSAISWVKTRLGKGVPLEPEPDPQGAWVVYQDRALGPVAQKFSPTAHGGMKRYRSHLDRCRPERRDGPLAPALKPDPTAGLAFPRRRTIGPFPPLAEVERRVRLSRSSWGAQGAEVACG